MPRAIISFPFFYFCEQDYWRISHMLVFSIILPCLLLHKDLRRICQFATRVIDNSCTYLQSSTKNWFTAIFLTFWQIFSNDFPLSVQLLRHRRAMLPMSQHSSSGIINAFGWKVSNCSEHNIENIKIQKNDAGQKN